MAGIVIVGAQWGDEGKGKIVDLFAESADLVIRFQGGNNAGHTIVNTRYEDGRAVMLTTNLDDSELKEQIGVRTVSRLYEMCGTPLPMFGEDRRLEAEFALPPAATADHAPACRGRWLSDADRAWEDADPDQPPAYGRPRAHRLD